MNVTPLRSVRAPNSTEASETERSVTVLSPRYCVLTPANADDRARGVAHRHRDTATILRRTENRAADSMIDSNHSAGPVVD